MSEIFDYGKLKDYVAGAGCECFARSKADCACDADWTPKEVYKQKQEISELHSELDRAYQRIAELEKEIESYKRAFIEMESNEVSRRKAQQKRDLEQQAQGVEDLKSWLHDYLSAVDLSDTAVMYIEEYAERLRKQAKELDQ